MAIIYNKPHIHLLNNLLSGFLPKVGTSNGNISFSSALNAAVSFSTGTFFQSHNPEIELTMLSHVFALIAQNFLSGATGIGVFIAFIREV